MSKKILLNNKEFHFTSSDLPCLIHGADHAGASLFTVTMMADLYRQGYKILFISGYPMARDEFLSQTSAGEEMIFIEKKEQIPDAKNKKVIFIQKENAGLFSPLIQSLPDLASRIVLIKNIDLFDVSIFNLVKDCPGLIISGNIDRCSFYPEVLKKDFPTKIFFSPSEKISIESCPPLLKYQGFLQGELQSGVIRITDG